MLVHTTLCFRIKILLETMGNHESAVTTQHLFCHHSYLIVIIIFLYLQDSQVVGSEHHEMCCCWKKIHLCKIIFLPSPHHPENMIVFFGLTISTSFEDNEGNTLIVTLVWCITAWWPPQFVVLTSWAIGLLWETQMFCSRYFQYM